MPTVYDLPPLSYQAQSQSLENARNMSRGISGSMRISQTRASRRKFQITFNGIGGYGGGAGYIEDLRRRLDGVLPLVRVRVFPDHWHIDMHEAIKARGHGPVQWLYQGQPMFWQYTAQPMTWWWSGLSVATGVDNGGNYLDVTGMAPHKVIAYPGELVEQNDITGRVVGVSRANASGAARIYVDTAFADGVVYISSLKWVTVSLDSLEPVTIPATGGISVGFMATEVFETDYFDPLEYENPWRVAS